MTRSDRSLMTFRAIARKAALVACVLALSGCRQVESVTGDATADVAGAPAVDLATTAPLPSPPPRTEVDETHGGPAAPPTTDSGSVTSDPSGHEPTAEASASPGRPSPAGEDPPPGRPSDDTTVVVANLGDQRGDAGPGAPDHADLVQVLVEESATTLRITVVVAGRLPNPTADGEVIGIGVDLYAAGDPESRYQVFGDGASVGWEAYLTGPDGVEALPGTFKVGADRLEFSMPAGRIDLRSGEITAFLDRADRARLVTWSTQDRLPDRGRHAFTRP